MVKLGVHNLKGEKVEDMDLDASVFAAKPKDSLIAQVYSAICSNFRNAIAQTKNRSARAGSTKKPWKQKGTGRARTGSVRNPIWRKGGIIFGPTNSRNFSKKVNKKVKDQAMRMVLSGKLSDNEIVVVDSWKTDEVKTKQMAQALEKLKIERSALAVFCAEEKEFGRAARNIPFVETVSVASVNIVNLLHSKFVVLSKEGVEFLTKQYALSEKSKEAVRSEKETEKSAKVKDSDEKAAKSKKSDK